MSRLAIFIDGGYLAKTLRNEFNEVRIDFEVLSREIASMVGSGTKLFRTYYYNCLPYRGANPDDDQRYSGAQSFFEALDRLSRYEVRLGTLARRGPDAQGRYRYEQKKVDVLLSIDVVQVSVKAQVTDIVLIAGDSDFLPAVEAAKGEGVCVWLFHGLNCHVDLWKAADERVAIDQGLIDRVRQ